MNNVGDNGYDETTELVDLILSGRLIKEHQKGSKILMMMEKIKIIKFKWISILLNMQIMNLLGF